VAAVGSGYEKGGERRPDGQWVDRQWTRFNLTGPDGDVNTFGQELTANATLPLRFKKKVLKERGEIDVICRPHSDGWIITLTLCNCQILNLDESIGTIRQKKNSLTLFQAGLRATLDKGTVGTYPRVDPALLSPEEAELELQYRHRHIYAVGHGAGADWSMKSGKVHVIRTAFIPQVEVPQVTADTGKDPVLGLAFLAEFAKNQDAGITGLMDFIDGYSQWVGKRKIDAQKLTGKEKEAGQRITRRMETALARMKKGVAFLKEIPDGAKAFAIANQAMLLQMSQYDKTQGKKRPMESYQWRPFQLAFFLTVLESTARPDSMERDLADLIWFPTGGGKTEAYLGVAAFVIALRRLTCPASGKGTCVIMRYTLRLLTAQQYLRATRIISAMEIIRQGRDDLGEEPISIGMWVGKATSPNQWSEAQDLVAQARGGKASSRLVLDACPWCATPFKAPENYHASPDEFYFKCTNPACDLAKGNKGKIPCNVVDEALYATPPTFLIATLDKFARLAWEPRTNAFFGGELNRPPELIIQDELHLISGALGSVAGLYEAGLHTILAHRGMMPKYLASTATIRMAKDQVARLYGAKVAVFPPSGLSCDDAYFARTVPLNVRSGRTYLGFLAPLLDRSINMTPLAATLLAAPEHLFTEGQVDRDLLLDAWWTLVVYHGSLKGVGNSHNLFNTGVRDFFARLANEADQEGLQILRYPAMVSQLTSVSSAGENAATFARLEKTREENGGLDAVLATNMISVGLDVARLALMVINGQPLTTAEYIQASSRVGRDRVPGIVFTNFYRDQARSLSHYENFRAFHESFYRFVEPTSITPYTFQARRRALHAALVISLRHGWGPMLANERAGHFDPCLPQTGRIIERLKQRCAMADPERAREITAHIDSLVREWEQEAQACRIARRGLVYSAPDRLDNANRLIHNHHARIKGLWPTLQSMRNVEDTALLKVIK